MNRTDEIAYTDPPVLRSVTLSLFINQDYPPGLLAACRTIILGPIVSSGKMDLGSMSGAVHV